MNSQCPSIIVEIEWLRDEMAKASRIQIPSAASFGTTGYRESESIDELFSVFVRVLDFSSGDHKVPLRAQVFPLVEQMADRLPGHKNDIFILTAGRTKLARCRVLEVIPPSIA